MHRTFDIGIIYLIYLAYETIFLNPIVLETFEENKHTIGCMLHYILAISATHPEKLGFIHTKSLTGSRIHWECLIIDKLKTQSIKRI